MEPTQPPPPVASTAVTSTGIFGTKIPASVAFLAAILLFLLPFAEIKCSGATIANQTGVGFVTKQEWKLLGMFDQKQVRNSTTTQNDSQGNSQIVLLVVLVLALVGFLLSITNSNPTISGILGLLSVVGLICFMIDLKSSFNASIHKDAIDQASEGINTTDWGQLNNVKPSLSFAPAFWISLLLLLAAAFFSWQRTKVKSVNT
jgi:hypothetical protein